jgi:adenylate cyclase
MIKKLLNHHRYSLLAPPLLLVILLVLTQAGDMRRLENLTVDWRMRQRAQFEEPRQSVVQVCEIQEIDLQQFGRWPWNRDFHTQLIMGLLNAPPAVLTLDLLFPEYQDPDSVLVDQRLGDAAAQLGVAVTGAFLDLSADEKLTASGIEPVNSTDFGLTIPLEHVHGDTSEFLSSSRAILPVPEVAMFSYVGFVDFLPDVEDGVRRRMPLVVKVGEKYYPSLSLQTIMTYWNLGPDDVEVYAGKHIVLHPPEGEVIRVPITDRGELFLNWRGMDQFERYSYLELKVSLRELVEKGRIPEGLPDPTGKIVLVGQGDAQGLTDLGATPLHPISPLVWTHATALANMLERDFARHVPRLPVALGWLVVGVLSLMLLRQSGIVPAILVPPAVVAVYAGLAWLVFWNGSVLMPVVWPVGGFLALHVGAITLRWKEEFDARQQVRDVFAKYISASVMNRLLRDPESIDLGGDSKAVAVMFSDIRGFTSISESLSEQELVAKLNQYFGRMVTCIHREDGTLHKYIGDAVMAVWGDVVDMTEAEAARRSVRGCLKQIEELEVLNREWTEQGEPRWNIGLGINIGTVMVGSIGAPQRREFTVIGDAVNAASRLEGLTKGFGVQLCVGETVAALLDEEEFIIRPLGLIVVKGKTRAIRVFEVMAERADPPPGVDPQELGEWAAKYNQGFELYLQRQFKRAAELFEQCLESRPDDICTGTYLDAARDFEENPPHESWTGVTIMKTK